MGRGSRTAVKAKANKQVAFTRTVKNPTSGYIPVVAKSYSRVTSKGVECRIDVYEDWKSHKSEEPYTDQLYEVHTDQGPAGYLKVSNVTEENFKALYPNILSYAVKKHNKYLELESLLEKKNWDKNDYLRALEETAHWSEDKKALKNKPLEELKEAWKDRKKFLKSEASKDYKKALSRVNQPVVDYIGIYKEGERGVYSGGKTIEQYVPDCLRKGIGRELYKTAAEHLAIEGLYLHASVSQTPAAKASWDNMESKGWIVRLDELNARGKQRRYIDPQAWLDNMS